MSVCVFVCACVRVCVRVCVREYILTQTMTNNAQYICSLMNLLWYGGPK